MRSLVFEGNTWDKYEQIRSSDKKLHKALCRLLKEMLRGNPNAGTGRPEPLKHNLSGLWSRRISQKDRLIYRFDDESVYIFAIGGHYDIKNWDEFFDSTPVFGDDFLPDREDALPQERDFP